MKDGKSLLFVAKNGELDRHVIALRDEIRPETDAGPQSVEAPGDKKDRCPHRGS